MSGWLKGVGWEGGEEMVERERVDEGGGVGRGRGNGGEREWMKGVGWEGGEEMVERESG